MHQRISTPPEPETFAVGFFVNAPSERIVAIYCRAGFLVSLSSRRDELLVRIPDQLQAAFALELPNEVTHSVEKQLLPSTALLGGTGDPFDREIGHSTQRQVSLLGWRTRASGEVGGKSRRWMTQRWRCCRFDRSHTDQHQARYPSARPDFRRHRSRNVSRVADHHASSSARSLVHPDIEIAG